MTKDECPLRGTNDHFAGECRTARLSSFVLSPSSALCSFIPAAHRGRIAEHFYQDYITIVCRDHSNELATNEFVLPPFVVVLPCINYQSAWLGCTIIAVEKWFYPWRPACLQIAPSWHVLHVNVICQPGSEACPYCGQDLCPECGAAISPEDTQCPKCGATWQLFCPCASMRSAPMMPSAATAAHRCPTQHLARTAALKWT